LGFCERRSFPAAVAVIAVTVPAQAATDLSTSEGSNLGAVFGPERYAANVGTAAVRVNSIKSINLDGPQQALSSAGNCVFPANISGGMGVSSRARRATARCAA
jgi:hypothetical protein